MSRRTTGIITAVVLILLGGAAGYGINTLFTTRAPEEGLSEAQVGGVATKLIAARNELLVTVEVEEDDDPSGRKTPPVSAELLEGRTSDGITMSQGAIVAERQTYRLLRERRNDLADRGVLYTEADLEVEVESLNVNESSAIAVVDETTTFGGERNGKPAELEQNIQRVMTLSRVEGRWIMRSIRTMSGKDAPENGL